jgi:hypothetical protein
MEIDELVPQRREEAAWISLEKDKIILNMNTGECTDLDPLTEEVWRLADGTRTVGKIIGNFQYARPDKTRQKVLKILGYFYHIDLLDFAGGGRLGD